MTSPLDTVLPKLYESIKRVYVGLKERATSAATSEAVFHKQLHLDLQKSHVPNDYKHNVFCEAAGGGERYEVDLLVHTTGMERVAVELKRSPVWRTSGEKLTKAFTKACDQVIQYKNELVAQNFYSLAASVVVNFPPNGDPQMLVARGDVATWTVYPPTIATAEEEDTLSSKKRTADERDNSDEIKVPKKWGVRSVTKLLEVKAAAYLDIVYDEGRIDLVDKLLQKGASANAPADYGWSPLMAAVSNDEVDCVTALLRSHADPNKCSSENGITALHLAADNGNMEIIVLLLANNADKAQKDKFGCTPCKHAELHQRSKEVTDLLEV